LEVGFLGSTQFFPVLAKIIIIVCHFITIRLVLVPSFTEANFEWFAGLLVATLPLCSALLQVR
jgi:hypothetical protein